MVPLREAGDPRLFFIGLLIYYAWLHTMMRFSLVAVAACLVFALPVQAGSPVLLEGGGITVTAADIQSELLRVPPETRAAILARPDSIRAAATNLYQRRVLAADALTHGADKQPLVQEQLQIARDRVLSDARLAQLDAAAQPNDATLDALAQSTYRAEPARFKHPEEVHARHILVGNGLPDARAKAEQLLVQLRAGASFEALARQHSTDAGSAARGGDLGWFTRGRMVPEFETAAFALAKAGDFSEIVESKFGFHIIQLQGKRSAGTRPFDEVRDELRKEAAAAAARNAREKEVQRLMGTARFDDRAIEALSATKP
jgi:peptidyl-prolyl cis-trans isomerase C